MADATPGYKADLFITGDALSMTGESLSDTGDGVTYQIDDSAKNVFNWATSLTVKENGTDTTSSNVDTINHLTGQVVFSSSPTEPVTIDGEYLPKRTFGNGRDVDFTSSHEELDVTSFGDSDVQRIYGLHDVEGSITGLNFFLQDIENETKTLSDVLENRGHLVLVYHPDTDLSYSVRAVIQLSEEAVTQSVDSLVEGTVSFTGAAPDGATFDDQVVFERTS